MIHQTAVIHESAQLADDVQVGPYAIIGEHVRLESGVQVGAHAVVEGFTEIGEKTRIFSHASVGTIPQDLKYEPCESYVRVGKRTTIREFVTINPGTFEGEVTSVGDDCLLMASSHVAHNCEVGNRVILANCGTLAGHVIVGDYAVIGGLAAVHQFVRIGAGVMIGGLSPVLKDVLPYTMASGNPARSCGLNALGLKRRGFSEEQRKQLKSAYQVVFRQKLTTKGACERLIEQFPEMPYVQEMVQFLEQSSDRGLVR